MVFIIFLAFMTMMMSNKDFFYLSKFFSIDSSSLSLFIICFLVFFILVIFNFSNTNFLDYFNSFIMFFLLVFFNMLCYISNYPLIFILLVEMTIVPITLSILIMSKDNDKIFSVTLMILLNMMGSIPFMFFSLSSPFTYCSISDLFHLNCNSFFMLLSMSLVLMSKLPIFLFHFWLTKAHVSASGFCSMLLASLMLKLGSFGLFKFLSVFLCLNFFLVDMSSSFSLYGSLLFCLLMLRFLDVKYLVACSSVVHMSFILPSLMIYSSEGVAASMLMMVGHGIVSCFLFFLVSELYESTVNRSLDFNKCLESSDKTISMFFILWIFLNLGVPPFMNFLGEFYFFLNFLNFSYSTMILFFLASVISVIFTMFLVSKSLGNKKIFMTLFFNKCNSFFSLIFLSTLIFMPYVF